MAKVPNMSSSTKILTVSSVWISLSVEAQVFNADAEPNDRFINAQPIALGTAFEGQLNTITGDEIDLYSFVLPDAGVLLLEVEAEHDSAGDDELDIRGFALEDSVNIMVPVAVAALGANNVPLLTNTQISCMKAGLHYLGVSQVESGGGTQPISYRITATHRPMAFANDMEPNNTLVDAIPLLPGAWAEGRLSVEWPNTDPADLFDHYVIHKTTTGPLVLHTELTAEYENLPAEPGNFHVHNADWTLSSDSEGHVDMGSQGVPAADLAIYPTMNDTGLFYVRLTNASGYGYCYRFMWSVGSVGLSEGAAPRSFTLAPNPAVHGSVLLLASGMERVELIDARGRITQVPTIAERGGLLLDLLVQPAGVYLVRVTFGDGHVATGPLVVAE